MVLFYRPKVQKTEEVRVYAKDQIEIVWSFSKPEVE